MKRKSPYFLIIDIRNFSVYLYTTKQKVADVVKRHRNTLGELSERMTVGNYIIIPIHPTK